MEDSEVLAQPNNIYDGAGNELQYFYEQSQALFLFLLVLYWLQTQWTNNYLFTMNSQMINIMGGMLGQFVDKCTKNGTKSTNSNNCCCCR